MSFSCEDSYAGEVPWYCTWHIDNGAVGGQIIGRVTNYQLVIFYASLRDKHGEKWRKTFVGPLSSSALGKSS